MVKKDTGCKIAFLFGAGAEGEGNYNMPTGMEYLIKSTLPQQDGKKKEDYIKSLDSFFNGKEKGKRKTSFFNGTYGYTMATLSNEVIYGEILFQLIHDKIMNDEEERVKEFLKTHRLDISVCLNKSQRTALKKLADLQECKIENQKQLARDRSNRLNELGKILNMFLIKEDVTYRDIEDDFYRELLMKEGADLDKEVAINVFSPKVSGRLDSYFHTIIDPNKYGPMNFGKIFNYYWKCYFTILEGILRTLEDDKLWLSECFLKEGLNYKKILARIPDITRKLYSAKIEKKENSYYELIKRKLKDCGDDIRVGVITTNYFHFAEKVIGVKEADVAYINGQLKYFEFPETLEVIDACADETENKFGNEKLFFPFIFGQSFVKPIVNHAQIEEFSKMQRILDEAEYLVVLGYNMNEDDNHLNAYLHDYLIRQDDDRKKTIIVVDSKDEEEGKTLTLKKLRCRDEEVQGRLIYCKVDYGNNEDVINKVFEKIDFANLM